MSWSGANEIIQRVVDTAGDGLNEYTGTYGDAWDLVVKILDELVDACEDADADTIDELYGKSPILDAVLDKRGRAPEKER